MSDQAETGPSDQPLISTGISQLDEFLAGGLDPGTLVLLVEPAGAGAEIFAKQFAAGGTGSTVGRSVYVTTEESEREVFRAFERFGFPTVPRVVPISEAYSRRILEKRDASARSVRERSTADILSSDSGDLLHAPIPEDS